MSCSSRCWSSHHFPGERLSAAFQWADAQSGLWLQTSWCVLLIVRQHGGGTFQKRVASALGAFHNIVQGFLKARNIAVAPKIQVVMATIVSRLLLYAGVWDPLSAAQVRKLNTVYMRALRAAMGKERGPHLHVTDLAVRIEAGVPSISTLVRRARLRLVARVAATDCDALKALTQDPHILAGDFFAEIKRDLVCLYDFDRRPFFVALPCDWVGPVVALLAHCWQVLEEICVSPQVSR